MGPNASDTKSQRLRAVTFDRKFLDLSYEWLHEPAIMHVLDVSPFSRAEQFSWWRSLDRRDDYKIWGIEADGERVGAFGVKSLTRTDGEMFIYLGDWQARGRGVGSWGVEFVANFMRKTARKNLFATVMVGNTPAVRLFEKSGFSLQSNDGIRMIYRLTL